MTLTTSLGLALILLAMLSADAVHVLVHARRQRPRRIRVYDPGGTVHPPGAAAGTGPGRPPRPGPTQDRRTPMSDDVYATETEALVEYGLKMKNRGDDAERELERQRNEFAAKVEHWRERAEVAERRLAELEPLPEWRCPSCGAVTRARMADHGDLDRTHAEWDRDDTQRAEHLAAADTDEDGRRG